MRIIWNEADKCFEAEFAQGDQWAEDQAAAKGAKFRTTGPPSWKWQAFTVKPLNALKKKRPTSGLSISQEALAMYTVMQEQFEKNEVVLKQLRVVKNERKKKEGPSLEIVDADGNFISHAQIPSTYKPSYEIIPLQSDKTCISCGDPVAFYERQIPPICLWCEKILVDKAA